MAGPNSAPFADVYQAFSQGLSEGQAQSDQAQRADTLRGAPASQAAPSIPVSGPAAAPPNAPAAAPAAAPNGTALDSLQVLQVLQAVDAGGGSMPFEALAQIVQGDAVANLSVVSSLVKQGLVELAGELAPDTPIRITDRGREMVGLLRQSSAVA